MTEEETEISDIKGIGPKLAERIRETLDIESIEQFTDVSEEQLTEVKGIGGSKAEKILNSLEDITKECDRCGQKFVGEDICPECSSELKKELEPIEKEIEYFKEDHFQGMKWQIEQTLEKIDSELSEENFRKAEELIGSVEEEVAEAQELSDKLSDIENKLEEENVINLSTYREELDLAWDYMRYGNYEECEDRAEKILEYLEEEEIYQDVDPSELLEENIEEFSRYMMGIGPRAGEKIYSSGFRTLEDIYKAGSVKIQKEAGIEETVANRLIDALDSLFEDLEIEREDETLSETEDQEIIKEEDIFRDTMEEEREEEKIEEEKTKPEPEAEEREEPDKTKKVKKKKVVKKKPEKEQKGPTTLDELLSMEEESLEEERELKHWIPAMVIPVLLAIAAYVLFWM